MIEIAPEIRIADLENELRQRDDKIKELRADLDEARDLVDKMRERVEDSSANIQNWIEVFDMQPDEAGVWKFDRGQSELWDAYDKPLDTYQKLVTKWNKTVGEFNSVVAPKDIGRPLGASDAQRADVLKRRKAGQSIRAIAGATNLSIRTVRTIIEKDAGTDRASKRAKEHRRMEFNRQRAADFRARKKGRDAIPKQITELQKDAEVLVKRAKGLAKR